MNFLTTDSVWVLSLKVSMDRLLLCIPPVEFCLLIFLKNVEGGINSNLASGNG